MMHAWEQIQQTIEYIEKHLNEDIRIGELARMASLSPFYYQRLFSRLVKKPVVEYIKLRRMAKATELLRNDGERILDIALALGFSSHEHFSRTFKDTFGMTPNEYRKEPKMLNHMTKPELLLHYTLIDEGVPLITDGIVLEINRRQLAEPVYFAGLEKKMPVQFVQDLGIKSGVDDLETLWSKFHDMKTKTPEIASIAEEIGVSYPCTEAGYFNYFAGARTNSDHISDGFSTWRLPKGDYIVCTFEAENFEMLVMDALHKANQYVFATWLPKHELKTEPFCAERYASHSPETTSMEIWLKVS